MKLKNILPVVAFISLSTLLHAQIYLAKTCDIKIFSEGPIENIDALNTTSRPILNAKTNDLAVKVVIKGFDFDSESMEEHFNEKYMESDKYPFATFSGKINETIDYKKDGVNKVTVTGKLKIHDVEKERTLTGTMTIKEGKILIESKFIVALKDHKIEVPSLVSQNISETIEVTLKSELTEYKK